VVVVEIHPVFQELVEQDFGLLLESERYPEFLVVVVEIHPVFQELVVERHLVFQALVEQDFGLLVMVMVVHLKKRLKEIPKESTNL
jgi:hypothetical protein